MGVAKAVIGALIAGLGTLATALVDNSITPLEWVGVGSTTLIAAYSVWRVPNKTGGQESGDSGSV